MSQEKKSAEELPPTPISTPNPYQPTKDTAVFRLSNISVVDPSELIEQEDLPEEARAPFQKNASLSINSAEKLDDIALSSEENEDDFFHLDLFEDAVTAITSVAPEPTSFDEEFQQTSIHQEDLSTIDEELLTSSKATPIRIGNTFSPKKNSPQGDFLPPVEKNSYSRHDTEDELTSLEHLEEANSREFGKIREELEELKRRKSYSSQEVPLQLRLRQVGAKITASLPDLPKLAEQPLPDDLFPLRERYLPITQLASGQYLDSFLVKDLDLQRLIVIKRLKENLHTPTFVLKFIKDIQQLALLEHPNIWPIYDVGIDEKGQLFYTTRYVEGQSLEEILQKLSQNDLFYKKRFPLTERYKIFLQILSALAFAHSNDILHCDIKPSSIFVANSGEIFVGNWGLSKDSNKLSDSLEISLSELPSLLDEDESASSPPTEQERMFRLRHPELHGTPAYMSPEQARGEEDSLGPHSDIYALGVLAYELFTTRHYLRNFKDLSSLLAHLRSPKEPSLQPLLEFIPESLSLFLTKSLAKSKNRRFSTVSEMMLAFQTAIFLDQLPPDENSLALLSESSLALLSEDDEEAEEDTIASILSDEEDEDDETKVTASVAHLPPLTSYQPPPMAIIPSPPQVFSAPAHPSSSALSNLPSAPPPFWLRWMLRHPTAALLLLIVLFLSSVLSLLGIL